MSLILHYGGESLELSPEHTLEQVGALVSAAFATTDQDLFPGRHVVELQLLNAGKLYLVLGESTPFALETVTGRTIRSETTARTLDPSTLPSEMNNYPRK
ncbi:MAG TPA: hypothetical protein VLZ78_03960 [Terrimesophilobacter sp.]|nr:hypothetical protein [Terrimesophilobacter sp.]